MKPLNLRQIYFDTKAIISNALIPKELMKDINLRHHVVSGKTYLLSLKLDIKLNDRIAGNKGITQALICEEVLKLNED